MSVLEILLLLALVVLLAIATINCLLGQMVRTWIETEQEMEDK